MELPAISNDFSIPVKEFDYPLPQDRIATFPKEQRDSSKLLVYRNGSVEDSIYRRVDEFLAPGSLLVFNNTRVVQARLHFKTSTGSTIEIFCLEPDDKHIEVNQAMQATGSLKWKCLVGELRKWKEEWIRLEMPDSEGNIVLSARLLSRESDAFVIEFAWTPATLTFAEILEKAGKIPLPPYIKRELSEEDKKRYQTIYAEHEGSVAAPTAGLHYTPEIFARFQEKNIEVDYVTLHIGAGTFKPIKTETVAEHEMHSEQLVVEKAFIEKLIASIDREIVAVGTTSLRTIESLYWLGLRIHQGLFKAEEDVAVKQWDPYQLNPSIPAKEALKAIVLFLRNSGQEIMLCRTQLLIVPGYEWKIVNVLATNFHQPKSTLIMLVAAFIGDNWKQVYNHALENDYRFLSYGDGSLLFRN